MVVNRTERRNHFGASGASGALGMEFGGRELGRHAAHSPTFFAALIGASGGRMVPVPGGVLIRLGDGEVVGAVGISGDASTKGEACAVHGIERAGLIGRHWRGGLSPPAHGARRWAGSQPTLSRPAASPASASA